MGIGYATAYRTGITPWEGAGRRGLPALEHLLDREERDRPGDERGRALDLGCGRGAHTKLLVDRGWDAVGVDDVRHAVDVAVHRNGLEDARFVIGDVRHLVHSGVGDHFDLFLDVGCFDALDADGRTSMARGVTALARPGAIVLVHLDGTRRWPSGSRGATVTDLEWAYDGWEVAPGEPGPDGSDARRGAWTRLTRVA